MTKGCCSLHDSAPAAQLLDEEHPRCRSISSSSAPTGGSAISRADTVPYSLAPVRSVGFADAVLELRAGRAKRAGDRGRGPGFLRLAELRPPPCPPASSRWRRGARHRFSKPIVPRNQRSWPVSGSRATHMAGVTVKHRSRVKADPSQPNLRQVHLIHGELFDELGEQGFA